MLLDVSILSTPPPQNMKKNGCKYFTIYKQSVFSISKISTFTIYDNFTIYDKDMDVNIYIIYLHSSKDVKNEDTLTYDKRYV